MHKPLFIHFLPLYIAEAHKWNTGKTGFDDLHDYRIRRVVFFFITLGFFKFGMSYASLMQVCSVSGTMN